MAPWTQAEPLDAAVLTLLAVAVVSGVVLHLFQAWRAYRKAGGR